MFRFHRLLRQGVIRVVAHPKLTLAISAAIVVGCVMFALTRLRISSDDGKLFPSSDRHIRDAIEFNEQFPENDAMYIVIEPSNPNAPTPVILRWTAVADRITEVLRAHPREVARVESRVPLDVLGPWGFLFQDPRKLEETVNELKRFVPLVSIWGEKPGALLALLGTTPMERFVAGLLT